RDSNLSTNFCWLDGRVRMERAVKEHSAFDFVGAHLGLDFANTVNCYDWPKPNDALSSYSHLISWAREAGILSLHEAQGLEREATRRPNEAAAVLTRVKGLREAIYRLFSSAVH